MATKLVDLKKTAEERKKDRPGPLSEATDDGPRYPYGIRVELEEPSLKKLGIGTMPKAGSKMHLQAEAHVKSVHDDQTAGGKKERRIVLELRKMFVQAVAEGNKDPGLREGKLQGAKAAMDKALDAQEGSDGDGDDDD